MSFAKIFSKDCGSFIKRAFRPHKLLLDVKVQSNPFVVPSFVYHINYLVEPY